MKKYKDWFSLTTAKDRVEYIDLAKGLAIFLVVLGHCVTLKSPVKSLVYTFHMPLFFMLSGFFLSKNNLSFFDLKKYFSKKVKALIFPFLVWALFYAKFSYPNFFLILYGTRESLIKADCLSSLWFLPVLFLATFYVFFISCVKVRFKFENSYFFDLFVITFLFAIGFIFPHNFKLGNIWGCDIAFVAAAFMLIGNRIPLIVRKLSDNVFFTISVVVLFFLIFFFTYQLGSSEIGYVRMADAHYGIFYYFILNSLLGSMIVVLSSALLSKHYMLTTFFKYLGQNTLGVFLVHKIFIWPCRFFSSIVGIDFNFLPCSFVIATIVTVLSLLFVSVINKYTPFLFGRI